MVDFISVTSQLPLTSCSVASWSSEKSTSILFSMAISLVTFFFISMSVLSPDNFHTNIELTMHVPSVDASVKSLPNLSMRMVRAKSSSDRSQHHPAAKMIPLATSLVSSPHSSGLSNCAACCPPL
uniref:Uncharacterized protein n=1 Tax=Arundo donax TaxID=35708 RepID=A0A0A8ZLX7_ARUDO